MKPTTWYAPPPCLGKRYTCNHPVIEELGIEGNYVVRRCPRCGTIERTLIKRNSDTKKETTNAISDRN